MDDTNYPDSPILKRTRPTHGIRGIEREQKMNLGFPDYNIFGDYIIIFCVSDSDIIEEELIKITPYIQKIIDLSESIYSVVRLELFPTKKLVSKCIQILEDIDEVKKYKNLHFTESYILQTFRHVFDKHNDKLDNIINSKN